MITPVGEQQRPLPKGEYKQDANHVRTADGKPHSYAPVADGPAEMHRLVQELESDEFQAAHPVQQCAYAHYCFVAIHPFADGNGRVARALASTYLYRAVGVPLLIFADRRNDYFRALRLADDGEPLPFVQFVLDCALGAVRLARETLLTAEAPQPRAKIDELHALLTTQGGLTHLELDGVGKVVREALAEAFSDRIGVLAPRGGVTLRVSWVGGEVLPEHRQTFRLLDPQQMLHVVAETAPPAAANVSVALGVLVSRERDEAQAVLVYQPSTTEELVFALGELHPSLTLAAKQRLDSLADRVLGHLIESVTESAAASLRQQGYGPPS